MWVDFGLINGKMSLTSFREVDSDLSLELKWKRSDKVSLELKWLIPTGMERERERGRMNVSLLLDLCTVVDRLPPHTFPSNSTTAQRHVHTSNHIHIVCMTQLRSHMSADFSLVKK